MKRLLLLWEELPPKPRAYVSFSNTFGSFIEKLITREELKDSLFLFGCKREYVFTEDQNSVPMDAANILGHNVWTCPDDSYPKEIVPNSERYFEFKNILKEAEEKSLVTWRVENYPSLIGRLLLDGHEVFYRGEVVSYHKKEQYLEVYHEYNGPYPKEMI